MICCYWSISYETKYRGANNSLARPGRKQATAAEDFDVFYILFIIKIGGILLLHIYTRVGTLIMATIYLQLIRNRYMLRSFTVLQCSHQHCVQPVASDVEVVGYL